MTSTVAVILAGWFAAAATVGLLVGRVLRRSGDDLAPDDDGVAEWFKRSRDEDRPHPVTPWAYEHRRQRGHR